MVASTTLRTPDLKGEVNQLKIDRILSAATKLFSKEGYANSTMDEVARSIGVTKPFVYYRFKDKADILAEICGRAAKLTHVAIVEALELRGSATERLKRFSESFAATVLENTDFLVIYKREVSNLRPKDRRAITEIRRKTDELVQALLRQGEKSGEFSLLDPAVTASSITGMLSFIVDWYRPHLGITEGQLITTVTQLSLRMAGA